MAAGVALFIGGGQVFVRGLQDPGTRWGLTAVGFLFGLRSLYSIFSVANPYSGVADVLSGLTVTLSLLAAVALALAGIWLLIARIRSAGWERAALLFVGAFALQSGVVPLTNLLIYLGADLAGLLGVLKSTAALAFLTKVLPTVVKGVGGVIGIVALIQVFRHWLLPRTAAWGSGLWAASDILLVVALWVTWGDATVIQAPLALEIRTSLFVVLPALALLAVAWWLARFSGPGRLETASAPSGDGEPGEFGGFTGPQEPENRNQPPTGQG